MNVVDSSGWLEYLADGTNADFFARSILATADVVVPTLRETCELRHGGDPRVMQLADLADTD